MSSVEISCNALQETIAMFSADTTKHLDHEHQDEGQGVKEQESEERKFSFGCSEAVMDSLREWIHTEVEGND